MVVRLDFTGKFEKLKKDSDSQAVTESSEPETPPEKTEESPAAEEKTIPVLPVEKTEVPDLKLPAPEKVHHKENTEPVPAEGANEVVENMKKEVEKKEETSQEPTKESDSSSEKQKKN